MDFFELAAALLFWCVILYGAWFIHKLIRSGR